MNRRDFLKKVTTVAGVLALTSISRLGFAEEKKKKKSDASAAGGAQKCDPAKGKAAEIKYVEDKKDVKDAALKVEKMGVPFDKQTCKNCVLYKADTKQCMLMTDVTCQVTETGWCMSWAKNPTATI